MDVREWVRRRRKDVGRRSGAAGDLQMTDGIRKFTKSTASKF